VKEDIMNQNHVQQLRLFRQLKEEQLQPEVNAWLKRCPLDVNRNINDYVPILNKLLIRSDQLYSEKKFSLSFIDCMKVGEFIMEMKRKRNDFKHSQKRLLQLLSASVTRAEKCKEEIVKSLHFGRKEQEEEIEQKSSQHLEYQQFQNKHNQQYHALDQKMEESVQQLEPECKPPSIPLPPLATTTPKDDFKLMRLHISMEQKKNEKIMKETKLHISMLKDEIKQKDCIIEETEKGNKMLKIKNISFTEDQTQSCILTGGKESSFTISVFCIANASSSVLPLTHSVARLELAIAEPQPKVLNFASTIFSSSTLICNFITSPHSGAPTSPVPT
jgi:hypothetical protein